MRGVEIHVLPVPHLIEAGSVVQLASVKHVNDALRGLVTACQLDGFSTVLRTRTLNRAAGFSKRYLREYVSEIRTGENKW